MSVMKVKENESIEQARQAEHSEEEKRGGREEACAEKS
jgi:hypothetical protein